MPSKFPTLVSFYTNTWQYKQHAERLKKECEYFKKQPYYIDETYIINNETINVHKDFDNYREHHYTPNYKTAKLLFKQFKETRRGYFFYNSLDN